MIFSLFRRRARVKGIEPLYGTMMARALHPWLYLNADVPDTFEGRFESVTLHASLVLRRLRNLPPPAADLAQDLVDRTFDGLESAMRESGISDVGVPKRMKNFARAFYGRLEAYDLALASDADPSWLAQVLARNVGSGDRGSVVLADYVRRLDARLADTGTEQFTQGRLPEMTEVVDA